MARKPAKRTYRKTPVRMIPWDPNLHPRLFRMASEDWTAPRQIRASDQARGLTYDANFSLPNGHVAALRIRIKRYADGTLGLSEETMSFRFYGPRGVKA